MAAAAWSLVTLATPDDVRTRVNDLRLPAHTTNQAELDFQIREKIEVAKDYIRQELIEKFSQVYPLAVRAFLDYAYRGRVALSELESAFDSAYYVWNPYEESESSVYYHAGIPTPAIQVDAANGEFLIDTTNNVLYINRAITTPPSWTQLQSEDMVNYILNPEELKPAAVSLTIYLMLAQGVLKLKANYESNAEVLTEPAELWSKDYRERFKRGFAILKVDLSGDGRASDFERAGMNVQRFFG